jgi:hypothetical protein
MGNVFKKTVTRPLPTDAELVTRQGVRLARWRDGKGKMKTSPVTSRVHMSPATATATINSSKFRRVAGTSPRLKMRSPT